MAIIRKVGGIRFLRIGRVQFSFCICKPTQAQYAARRAKKAKALANAALRQAKEELVQQRKLDATLASLPPLSWRPAPAFPDAPVASHERIARVSFDDWNVSVPA